MDYQKTPIAANLNRFAEGKVSSALTQLGRSLPCSVVSVNGSIVTVKFELTASLNNPFTLPNITVPIAESEYVRLPIQVGCKGKVDWSDAYLDGVTGLNGGNTADLAVPGSVSSGAFVFVPLSNKGWSSAPANTTTIYGEPGVVVKTKDGSVKINVEESGVTISIGSVSLSVSSSGVTITGGLTIDGIAFGTHIHAVTAAPGSTGPPEV